MNLFLLLLSFAAVRAETTTHPQIRILYISSFESDSHDTAKVIEILKQDLLTGGWRPEIYLQSLDTFRFPQTEETRNLFDEMLERRYADIRFNIILAQASDALRAAERYRRKLSYEAPVYCFDWIDASLYERFSKIEGYYGRTLSMSFPPTLHLAASLFPAAKRVSIVASPIDPEHIPALRSDIALMRMSFPHLDLVPFFNTEYETVKRALSESTADSLTLLLPGSWLLADGEQLGGRAALERLDAAAPMPYFGITIDTFGSGLVGGCFVDREQMGHEAASITNNILKNDARFAHWGQSDALVPTIDYRALKRFDVKASLVPPDAKILYLPESGWIRYEIPIKIAISFLIVIFIALLAYSIMRRRERQILIRANAGLELMVEERTAELTQTNDELVATNESLREAIDELDEAKNRIVVAEKLAALGRLTANISHELNTPLAAISSASYTLTENLYSGIGTFADNPAHVSLEAFAFIRESMERVKQNRINTGWCGSEAERIACRIAEAKLRTAGIVDADSIAQEFTELGIADLVSAALPFLTGTEKNTFMAMLRATLWSIHAARVIDDSVTRASRVVLMLRTYARSGESDAALKIRLTDVVPGIIGLTIQINPDVSIDVEISDDLNIFCRLEDLKTILYNLIKNAMQAVQNTGHIIISAHENGDFVHITVTDSGVGIAESIKDRVFEPFFSTRPMGEGAGFGLDVALRLAKRNGGDIFFVSNPGLTVFTVRLPVALR